MAKQTIDVMVSGGKATAAPPLGPALGPTGLNLGEVIKTINEKTKDFVGMNVPVKVIYDDEDKTFEIEIGTPPAAELIKKEAGIEKGAGNPKTDMVADLKLEQLVKIANMKESALLGKDKIQQVKEIAGTCNSMGVMVEGKKAVDAIADINTGMYDEKILSGKTELTAEENKVQEEEKKQLQEEIKVHHAEFVEKAKSILAKLNSEAETKTKRKALQEAEIPMLVIDELAPEEKEK